MIATAGAHPLSLLQEIERRSKAHAFDLPQQELSPDLWSGIGFRLGTHRLLAPLQQAREILVFPRLSPLPGAKGWVKGLANVRGELLTVMDLGGFIKGVPTPLSRRTRVLVVEIDDLLMGLYVDEVFGLKHFLEGDRAHESQEAEQDLSPYLAGAFLQAGEVWTIFDFRRLSENPEFMQVAQ